MEQKEFKSVKQYLATLAVAICCAMSTTVFTACSNEDTPAPKEQQTDLVLNFGDIVIKPYLAFGTSLADAEKYLQAEYPDYANWESTGVQYLDNPDEPYYYINYYDEDRAVAFYFNDADCNDLDLAAYSFYSDIQFDVVTAELERHGFKNMGKLTHPDTEELVIYPFLSADGKTEAQIAIWYATEEFDEMWAISFQPFDENDLERLEK